MSTVTSIYTTAEVRALERAAGASEPSLMERAGAAATAIAAELASEQGADVLVLAGPGNNGGDAYEVAVGLKERFFRVALVTPADTTKLPPDASRAMQKWHASGGKSLPEVPQDRRWALVVDGLFGIGLTHEPKDNYGRLIDFANAQPCPRLALDIPSGLESDSGRVLGRAVRATHTITFIALKPGLLTLDGPDHCGVLSVADLGLTAEVLVPSRGRLAGPVLFQHRLALRPRNFHKGKAGSIGILGGAGGMVGAALLTGRAALKLGAGRVYIGLLDEHGPRVDAGTPELMLRRSDDLLGLSLDALVVGPGLGQSERAAMLIRTALTGMTACVLDADALNLLAQCADLRRACVSRQAETLITPHPAEAARLLACDVEAIQRNRLEATHALAHELNAHAVLKGNGSIVAARDGCWFVNTSGNPGMATAGMGDVLSGFLGALLGQGLDAKAALVLGVHLHGCAADALVAAGVGPVGITASELLEPARGLWNAWLRGECL